jgi:urease accessory protein
MPEVNLDFEPVSWLYLLQLASSALPVGAYSYSEGIETLVSLGVMTQPPILKHWLEQELNYGAIRLEAAVMLRGYRNVVAGDLDDLIYWNAWLSAAKETQELRSQSWQMGRSLIRLLLELQPQVRVSAEAVGNPCNYAIAFGIAAAHWQIAEPIALLGYLHSWASNLINAAVKLIPLGQTAGQQVLVELYGSMTQAANNILNLEDDALCSCGWGLALASMAHETQYTRLFRS